MIDDSMMKKILANPEKMQRMISEHLVEMVTLRDLDGALRYVSPSVKEVLGFDPETFISDYQRIVSPESRYNRQAAESLEQFRASDNGEQDIFPVQLVEMETAQGRSVIHEVRERYIREDGKRVAILGVSVDVSGYLHQLEELQGSNQSLMIIHHAQHLLLERSDREELLTAALEASLSMLEFDAGVVYDIDLHSLTGRIHASRNVPPNVLKQLENFPLSRQMADGTMESDKQTNALLFPPGHSWLAPLKPLGKQVIGNLFLCHGAPEAFVAVSCTKPFSREIQRLFQAVGAMASHAIENSYLHDALDKLSVVDTVTGLYNRAYADKMLAREDRLNKRYHKTAAVLVAMIGDENGPIRDVDEQHPNELLVRTATLLRKSIRTTDTIARYSGGEFLMYLPETGEVGARRLVARFNDILAEQAAEDGIEGARLYTGVAATSGGDKPIRSLILEAREELNHKKP